MKITTKNDLKNGMVIESETDTLSMIIPKETLYGECQTALRIKNDFIVEGAYLIENWFESINNDFTMSMPYGDIVKIYKDYTLKEIVWEKKKEILDQAEKDYLGAVIKPFRDKIDYIIKRRYGSLKEYVIIILKSDDNIPFPSFNKGYMYKGMEINEMYTLEELGL